MRIAALIATLMLPTGQWWSVAGDARRPLPVHAGVRQAAGARAPEDASDTRPQYAWYGRSLWIYDVATNADGLWLDPATNGGVDGVAVAQVFHVPFGASRPVVVHRGGRAAMWLAASAHTVWVEQISGQSSVAIWRIDGTTVRLLVRPKTIGFQGAYTVGRLWELTCGVKEHVLRLDPTTGASTPVGQFLRGANYCDASLAAAGGDAFVLEGQRLYVYG